MKRAYFDVSYLAKLHWKEPGTPEVLALAFGFATLCCSQHGRIEFAAVGHRKMRERLADLPQARSTFAQMEEATHAGAIQWLPLSPNAMERVERFFLSDPGSTFLRAADALHLACAAEHGFTEVYSNDRHFLAAAPLFGLRGVNVIPSA
ncbi:MAG TPA: type II toxin-antitoxin system VapC family toxin [Bacteroidia bacterium]|nr:type II toxin-antitoxin system VapC family toxin [Bacteroidia bacterium]